MRLPAPNASHSHYLDRSLDKELATHLRLKSTSFKVNLLSFCQSSRDVEMMSAEKAVDKKTQADLACLKFKLEAESALFESHRLATREWEHASASARVQRLAQLDDLVQSATNEYIDLRFPIVLVQDKDEATSKWCTNVSVSVAAL